MKLADSHRAGQSWFVHFLAILALVLPVLMLTGCGKGTKNQLANFNPVGTWVFKNSQFVFDDDGQFRREVIGPNPENYWWKGEWRREGDTIRAKYTDSNCEPGQEVVFEIYQEDFMRAPKWGAFQRVKPQAMPDK